MGGEQGIQITPDAEVLFQWGFVKLTATIVLTWVVMAVLVLGSYLITRKVTSDTKISRWQNLLEVLVGAVRGQIRQISEQDPDPFLVYVGTLFLFILTANWMAPLPIYEPPTGSLSLTAALALCTFFAVPYFSIRKLGIGGYLKSYTQPFFFMAPINIISELSRTLSLAVRLYGNVMSETIIAAVLLTIVPLLVPMVMEILGLITGAIQAYIFAVLSMVYIAAGTSGEH